MQGAGGDPNRSLPVSYRLAAGLVSNLLGVAVDERRHCVAGNGGHRAVGAVRQPVLMPFEASHVISR